MTPTDSSRQPRVALYLRVSTLDQHVDNQAHELRALAATRGWRIVGEYTDEGVSGSRDRRPALDRLMLDARRGRVDVVAVWSLDRFGRSLAHVCTAVQELHERGVAFVSVREGLDLSTAAGRLQLHILSALSEFERARLVERTRAGLARARRQGTRLGRQPIRLTEAQLTSVAALPVREAARRLGVSVNTLQKARRAMCQQTPATSDRNQAEIGAGGAEL
jgi:DNA invertase Pin-like site-specific DNA recombinase